MDLSIVIPAYNAQSTLPECLRALGSQMLPGHTMETIVVDDGSKDSTADVCRDFAVTLIRQKNGGPGAARNTGIDRARGKWIALTDADCIASRRWAHWLLLAAERAGSQVLGVAGMTVGHQSETPAARFVDLSGGLDAQRHLAHPTFPFAPTCNVLYRRSALLEVAGFDERFRSYEAADLHRRLVQSHANVVVYEPRAVVLHRHRASWRGYWKQQRSYGDGYAQLFLRYPDALRWGIGREVWAWGRLAGLALGTLAGTKEKGLLGRGTFFKQLAQRVGFVATYFNERERRHFASSLRIAESVAA